MLSEFYTIKFYDRLRAMQSIMEMQNTLKLRTVLNPLMDFVSIFTALKPSLQIIPSRLSSPKVTEAKNLFIRFRK